MKNFCKLIFVITFLAASFTIVHSQTIQIPKGVPVSIDGKFSAEEWKNASRHELNGGGEIHLEQDDGYLYVCMRGSKQGWGHVYITRSDTIFVLHASAALGTAIYCRSHGDVWQPVQEFSWAMRDTSLSQEAVKARERFLETNGWVANTVSMGTTGTLEFKIARKFLNNETPSFAALFASDPKLPQFWPPTLKDDCLAEKLIYGTTPADLKFNRESWAKLKL
jgi:hypothetical protein